MSSSRTRAIARVAEDTLRLKVSSGDFSSANRTCRRLRLLAAARVLAVPEGVTGLVVALLLVQVAADVGLGLLNIEQVAADRFAVGGAEDGFAIIAGGYHSEERAEA